MCRTKGARAEYSIDRDESIFQMLGEGKSVTQMAGALFVTENHMRRLIRELRKSRSTDMTKQVAALYFKEQTKAA